MYDKNGRFIIAKVKMTLHRLFPLKIQREKFSYLSYVTQGENWLRHMHFGHYHFSELIFLSRKQLVFGLPIVQILCVCETCQLEKKQRIIPHWKIVGSEKIVKDCALKSMHW